MTQTLILTLPDQHQYIKRNAGKKRMTKDLSNEALLSALKEGQNDVFSLLVSRMKSQLFNMIYRFLGNYQDAEDVVQDTFIKIYLNIDKYNEDYKATTWIYTIAMNLARTNYRKKHRWIILASSLKKDDDSADIIENIPDLTLSPEFYTDSNAQQQTIENAIQKITPQFREAMILRDMEGLTYEEISVILDLNIGTVKSRINRAREEFKKNIAKEVNK